MEHDFYCKKIEELGLTEFLKYVNILTIGLLFNRQNKTTE